MSKQSVSPEYMRWIIYGANGYTGELIAREVARHGLKPVLAGVGTKASGRWRALWGWTRVPSAL